MRTIHTMERTQQQRQVKDKETTTEGCEFTTTQEYLARAVRALGGVAGRNPALPILSHVLLKREQNHLRLSTTDLEVGVTAWLAGKIRGDGALTVPLRSFAEYVQNLPESPVTLTLSRGALTVDAKGAHGVFQGDTAENFPLIPHLAEGLTLQVDPVVTSRALDAVLYAVAADDTRPELAGVYLRADGQLLTLAATDSYRLAEAEVPLAAPVADAVTLILPSRGMQEIRRALEGAESAVLRIGENQVLLITPSLHVVSRRVEGTYPEYTQIIPKKQPTILTTDRVRLLRAIRASAVFSGNTVSRVTFEVGADQLRVTATTPEVGNTETELPAEVRGDGGTIAFNERFLRDALSALPAERVEISLGSQTTPAVFRPVAEDALEKKHAAVPKLLALVMPIKT